ncbi:MAG: acyltransferase family protein, partial [Muribaculaceae bacterium]
MLIIAVVIIHSNLANELSVEHNFVCYVVDFISGTVCNSVAVPCFFITSAFLFFRNIKKFTAKVYLNKLYSRVHSLLIPYIIWNVIACTLFLFKVYKLHFDGLGIVEDGSLNWANFLTGFFYIDQAQSEPFAFAFWFIRNLMVFIVLSPIFRLVSHDLITLMTTIAVFHILGFSTYYGEWFAFGAYLGLYHKDLALFNFNKGLWIVAAVFVASCCAMHYSMTYGQEGVLRAITHYVVVISAFIL